MKAMKEPAPRPEAFAAAEWWAQQLAAPARQDIGSALSSAFADTASRLGEHHYTDDQIEAFRQALAEAIERDLSRSPDSWRPDEPMWGSAMRGIHNDYGPDPLLTEAAEAVGIKLTLFDVPMKTNMWINPGIVKVGAGHGAGIATVWEAPPAP